MAATLRPAGPTCASAQRRRRARRRAVDADCRRRRTPARGHRQGRHRQDHGRRPRSRSRWPPAAGGSCWSRSRAGRASRSCSTPRRCRTRSDGSRSPRTAARSTRWRSTPRRRCWSTSTCSTSCGRAGTSAATRLGADRLRHHHRARPARRAAHRQGVRGGRAASGGGRRDLRRGGAGRAADRPDHPLPQRQHRGGRAGQGRPDPQPGRHDHGLLQSPRDGRAPRHAARGDAGPGDGRTPSPSCAPSGCRSARSSSTWCAGRRCAPTDLTRRRQGQGRRGRRVAPGCAPPGCAPAAATVAALLDEAAEHAARSRWRSASATVLAALGPADLRAATARRRRATSAACTSSPRSSRDAGMADGASLRARRARRRRLLDDPATRIMVCCGSGGVGKTTTAAALGAAGRRAGRTVVRAHDRPGPPAGAVDGARPSWTTPRGWCTGVDAAAGGGSTR